MDKSVGTLDVQHEGALVIIEIPEHKVAVQMSWRLAELLSIALLNHASEAKKQDEGSP